jgi:soluble lytic murein transglycosylase-like protein
LTGIGLGATAAAANPVTVVVTLPGGKQVTVNANLPSGTPLDQVQLPGITLPIARVELINGDPAAKTPAPAPAPAAPTAAKAKHKHARRHKAKHAGQSAATQVTAPAASSTTAPRDHPSAKQGPKLSVPAPSNPTFSYALPGPAPIGVPSFFIDKFRIPPFLLPIYQAAGTEYGVRWEVLAAINEIETDYGRNLDVSSAGALGWMQFIPETWKRYGVDANRDGKKDPYNPVDAIFAAARYLKAAGASKDIRKAIFAYNHADWYVDSVLMRARLISGIPSALVESLTGLTEGRFPVDAPTRYARSGPTARLFAQAGSRVVAVQDGKVVRIGHTHRLGRFVQLRDNSGNVYTYGDLGSVARSYRAAPTSPGPVATVGKIRLFANPDRPAVRRQLRGVPVRRLKVGSLIKAGTTVGEVGPATRRVASHLAFEIRPAGVGAPRIDPKPILDGWQLLESTAVYRALGQNPLTASRTETIGQILLQSKTTLMREVLANPRIDIYACGRRDIKAGIIDRRVLATLEFLAASGMRPTVSALRCGHGYLTSSGNVSDHSSGNAVDIAKINGIPILGHQGEGSITDLAVRRLLTLQGAMRPSQIITLMTYDGASNTLALPDHNDHIHVGFTPQQSSAFRYDAVLKPEQWTRFIARLGQIENPTIDTPSGGVTLRPVGVGVAPGTTPGGD